MRLGQPVRDDQRLQAQPGDVRPHRRRPDCARAVPRVRSCGSTSACSTSTWSASRSSRPTSSASRSTPMPATASSTRCSMYISARQREAGRRGAQADPRLGAPQRARQAGRSRRCSAPSAVELMDNIQARTHPGRPKQYGAEIVDVRIKPRRPARRHAARFERVGADAPPRASSKPRSILRRGRQAGPDHPRRRRCRRRRKRLCRQLRQGSGLLRFLPGDAVLQASPSARTAMEAPGAPPTSSCRQTTNICSEFKGSK